MSHIDSLMDFVFIEIHFRVLGDDLAEYAYRRRLTNTPDTEETNHENT